CEIGGVVEKYFTDAPIAASQGFEHADHLCAFEDENEQSGDHVDAGHDNHDADDQGDIKVKQREPLKDGGVFLFDRPRIEKGAQVLVNLSADFIDIVKIIGINFKPPHLVVLPFVDTPHLLDIGNDIGFIKFAEPG